MCEGFVDGVGTAENVCSYATVSAYDYSYENLMYQAATNRWVPFNATERPDNPFTFGPMPNTKFYVEQFNALANGVNLLTDLRVMLPAQFESRPNSGSASKFIDMTDECGDPSDCSSVGTQYFASATDSLSASASPAGGWSLFTDLTGGSAGYNITSTCSGTQWQLESDISTLDLRWELTDADATYALPGDLEVLMSSSPIAMMEFTESITTSSFIRTTSPVNGDLVTLTGDCAGSYLWVESVDVLNTTYCGIATSSLASASVPAGAIIIARWDLTGAPGTTAATQSGSAKTGSIFSDGVALIRCPTVAYSGGS